MSWSEVKKALNSTVGTSEFKPLNELISDMVENKVKEISLLSSGSFTVSSDVSTNYYVEHGLDGVPNFYVLMSEKIASPSAGWEDYILFGSFFGRTVGQKSTSSAGVRYFGGFWDLNSSGSPTFNSKSGTDVANVFDSNIFCISCSSSIKLKAGEVYRWFCGAWDYMV